MRCISVRQPWAHLIVSGKRPLEIRKWQTPYRGKLLIHAGLAVERRECECLRVFPSARGAIIGVVTLVDIRPLTAHEWKKLRPLHLQSGNRLYGEKTYAWIFENPEQFPEPIPYRGVLSLFDVPEHLLPRTYTILKNGTFLKRFIPGKYAGWAPEKIFGRLDCNSGMRTKKENRVFFHSYKDAIEAGYRPCKVCKPAPENASP